MNKNCGKILIADDNVQILNSLKLLLKQDFEEIITIKNPNQLPEMIRTSACDVILLDMNFHAGDNSGNEGLFWLREILKQDPSAVVIMITAYGDIDLAVKAIKEGATDFITKPWDAEKLLITLRNAAELKKSKSEVKKLRGKQDQLNADIDKYYKMYSGSSDAMQEIFKTIDKVAKTDVNVLLLGENGTGKELVAREIHRKSKRSGEIFLSVDMGSLSESLFESELFGHVQGAFTDAKENRAGRFETASGGTLFLDEIGNFSTSMQAKILSVLQDRMVTRVGSNKAIPINIRLITATNKAIEKMVELGQFREDLYYRINTIQIELPPLRERKEDIQGLAEFFLNQYSPKYNKGDLKLSSSAIDLLKNYYWPGNIRELKHTIEKAVILCDTSTINAEDLYLCDKNKKTLNEDSSYRLLDIEKKTIESVLAKCKGNLSKAAQMLDISRTTLYAKIEKFKLM